ncbi:MAG: hypothetical protein HQK78_19975 [Desulfobacterales bacterium]|nr:hypothetical protein [Desulfobacterales bacterium]
MNTPYIDGKLLRAVSESISYSFIISLSFSLVALFIHQMFSIDVSTTEGLLKGVIIIGLIPTLGTAYVMLYLFPIIFILSLLTLLIKDLVSNPLKQNIKKTSANVFENIGVVKFSFRLQNIPINLLNRPKSTTRQKITNFTPVVVFIVLVLPILFVERLETTADKILFLNLGVSPFIIIFLVAIGINGIPYHEVKPNVGIRLMAVNSLYFGLLISFFFLCSFILVFTFLYIYVGDSFIVFLLNRMQFLLLLGLLCTSFIFMPPIFLISLHYTTRLLLYFKKNMPLNHVPFLDHACKLIFLQRVGGGYIFIHRFLLEYFADLGEAKRAGDKQKVLKVN